MKKLSKLFIAVLFTAIAFTSCKKNSDNSPAGSTMTFTANGKAVTFNTCVAVTASLNDVEQVMITGTNLTNGSPGVVSFEVEITHALATLKAGQTYPVGTSFAQQNASVFYYFTSSDNVAVSQPGKPVGTVTLTEVTSTSIKGTFSGKLFAQDDFDGTTLLYTIAGGSFTAKISK